MGEEEERASGEGKLRTEQKSLEPIVEAPPSRKGEGLDSGTWPELSLVAFGIFSYPLRDCFSFDASAQQATMGGGNLDETAALFASTRSGQDI